MPLYCNFKLKQIFLTPPSILRIEKYIRDITVEGFWKTKYNSFFFPIFIIIIIYRIIYHLHVFKKIFPATGGLLPKAEFKTLKLLRYVNNMDTVVFVCEVLFFVYLLYYTVEELIEIKVNGKAYFSDFWSYYDIFLLVLGKSFTHFFIGNSIFHQSLELLTKFWKTSLKVA